MALRNKNVSILMKIETTEGVDASPVAADGFWAVAGSAPEPVLEANTLDDVARGTLTKLPAAPDGPVHMRFSFKMPVRGAGAAYSTTVKPKCSVPNRICGLQETITTTGGSEKIEYKPRSTGLESATTYVYLDGLLYKMLGCRGNRNVVTRAGGLMYYEYTIEGTYSAPTDATLVAPTGEPTDQYPIFVSSAFQIGTENYAAPFQNININLNNTLTPQIDSTQADGVKSIHLTDRNPDGSFDPEAALVATFGYYAKWKAKTLTDMSFTHGSAQYKRVKFTLPQVTFNTITPGDRNGLAIFTVPFDIGSNSAAGDDEFTEVWD